ncbi:uncharacterized protein LOC133185832 [Saccostrea echinata]|uniref:uncharacterized protein LOC133185832 n=1 Tax=Saccostrea echinata TaxID=191078 RepID=UPI002A7F0B73|nr:uncharacterized protein LOC133185832 [Saccostrea echinata]
MKFAVRWVIFFESFILYSHLTEAVTKYACVSYSAGLGGGVNAGYGGIGVGGLDFDTINSAEISASSEEIGMGLGGYGTVQHGLAPGVPAPGVPVQNLSPGISPLAASSAAGGLSAQNTAGGTASDLPNTAASLGGASHITGQGSNVAGTPEQMPFQKLAPGHPGIFLTGSLSCVDRPGTTILITKLVYGNGGIYTCSAPDQDCDVIDYKDSEITPFCDGQIKCVVRTTGKLLPTCQTTSNFVHVEYECITAWSSFDICNDIKTVVQQPEVFIMSPSFFQSESPPSKLCECILKGRYDNRIMAQYVHTDIHEGNNHSCPESFVLFENKLSPNQTESEKKIEVCGRRSLNNYMYKGDLRITFKDVDSGKRSGFVSKLLVPPVGIGVQNEIAMECGPVRMPGDPTPSPNSINRNFGRLPGPFGPFAPMGALNSQFQQSPRIPAPPVFEGMQQTMQPNNWGMPLPGMNPGPKNWMGPTNWVVPSFPRFSAGPQNLQFSSSTSSPPPAWSRNQNQPSHHGRRNGHQVHFMGGNRRTTAAPKNLSPYGIAINNNRRNPPTRSRLRSKDAITKNDEADNMVVYIIGGVGAIMAALCTLFISIYCTRRRQRILERRASQRSELAIVNTPNCKEASETYNVTAPDDESHTSQCINNDLVNKAFDETEITSCGENGILAKSFEVDRLEEDDNYQSLEEVEEGRLTEDDVPSLEVKIDPIDPAHCEGQDKEESDDQSKDDVYDNNV